MMVRFGIVGHLSISCEDCFSCKDMLSLERCKASIRSPVAGSAPVDLVT